MPTAQSPRPPSPQPARWSNMRTELQLPSSMRLPVKLHVVAVRWHLFLSHQELFQIFTNVFSRCSRVPTRLQQRWQRPRCGWMRRWLEERQASQSRGRPQNGSQSPLALPTLPWLTNLGPWLWTESKTTFHCVELQNQTQGQRWGAEAGRPWSRNLTCCQREGDLQHGGRRREDGGDDQRVQGQNSGPLHLRCIQLGDFCHHCKWHWAKLCLPRAKAEVRRVWSYCQTVSKDWRQDPAVWSGRTNLCLQCWCQGGNQWDSFPQGNSPMLPSFTICRTVCPSLAGILFSSTTQLAGSKPTREDSHAVITRTYSWTGRPILWLEF